MRRWIQLVTHHEVFSATIRVLRWSGVAVFTNGLSGVLTARVLAVADKGILAMVLSVGGLLFVVTALGTNLAIRIEFPRAGSRVSMRDYLQVTLKLLPLHATATLVLVWIASRYMSNFRSHILFVALVLLLSMLMFLSSQALDALHAFSRSSLATRSDAMGALLTTTLLSLLFVMPGVADALTLIVGCYAAGYALRVVLATRQTVILNRRAVREGARGNSNTGAQSGLVRFGTTFLGYNVGQTVAFRIDRYLLGIVADPRALGIYSVATTPAEMLRLPVIAFSQIMMQRVAIHGLSSRLLVRTCLATAAITLPPAAVVFVLADPIIHVLFGDRYAGGGQVLQVMVLAELAVALFLVLARIGAAVDLGRAMGVAAGAGAASSVTSLIVLAPHFGAMGAAWASFAGNLTMTGFCLVALIWKSSSRSENSGD